MQDAVHFYDKQGDAYAAAREHGFLRWLTARDLQAVLQLLAVQPKLSALDVGCGAGLHARVLTALGMNVTAVDLSPRMIELVRPHVAQALVADLNTLQLELRFDRVLCCGVLDFAKDPEFAVRRLAQHVAPGGRLLLMVPRRSLGGHAYALWHRSHGVSARLYTAAELDRWAGACGLQLIGHRYPFVHSLISAWGRRSG